MVRPRIVVPSSVRGWTPSVSSRLAVLMEPVEGSEDSPSSRTRVTVLSPSWWDVPVWLLSEDKNGDVDDATPPCDGVWGALPL